MNSILIPLLLTVIAIITVFYTYSNIRRGGARVYSLERETILRRATSTLFLSMALFLASIGLLIFQTPATPTAVEPAAELQLQSNQNAIDLETTPLPESAGSTIPGLITLTPTATLDFTIPTATATPIIIRAFITGTGGNGLQLRETPGGEPMEVLSEDSFVTVLEEEGSVERDGFTWVKVRTFLGDEGWVADAFIEIEER